MYFCTYLLMLVLDDLQGKVETANFLRTFLNFKLSFDFLMKTYLHKQGILRFLQQPQALSRRAPACFLRLVLSCLETLSAT